MPLVSTTVSTSSSDFDFFPISREFSFLPSTTTSSSSSSFFSGDLEPDFDDPERLLGRLEEFSLSFERDLDLDCDADLDLDLCFRRLCFFFSLDFDLDECFLCLCFLERFSLQTSQFFFSTLDCELSSSSLALSSFMYTDFRTFASSSEIKLIFTWLTFSSGSKIVYDRTDHAQNISADRHQVQFE